jgi:hypothetical protein
MTRMTSSEFATQIVRRRSAVAITSEIEGSVT